METYPMLGFPSWKSDENALAAIGQPLQLLPRSESKPDPAVEIPELLSFGFVP
jgi:hypothetical protein